LLFFFRANRSMLVFFSLSSLLLLLLIINAVILPELMQQSCLISYSWDSFHVSCVCVCVCGSRRFLLQSDTIVGDLQSKVRKECSWQKERVTACRQTDLQCATERERERDWEKGNFLAFLLHASSWHFSWAAHRSLCFAAENVIISRRCKLVWS
jgi:hypothetical protein